MDTWESFFREKSARRAAYRNPRRAVTWAIVSGGFLAVITAVVVGFNALSG